MLETLQNNFYPIIKLNFPRQNLHYLIMLVFANFQGQKLLMQLFEENVKNDHEVKLLEQEI